MTRGRILITGAGSGIGKACALYLADEGFHIIAAGRRREPLEALQAQRPGSISITTFDVTEPESIEQAIPEISPIDGVVNNAGIAVMGPIEGVPLDEWRRQFETNVFGVANVCRAVLPQMRQRGEGRIINIGSVTGRPRPRKLSVASSEIALAICTVATTISGGRQFGSRWRSTTWALVSGVARAASMYSL